MSYLTSFFFYFPIQKSKRNVWEFVTQFATLTNASIAIWIFAPFFQNQSRCLKFLSSKWIWIKTTLSLIQIGIGKKFHTKFQVVPVSFFIKRKICVKIVSHWLLRCQWESATSYQIWLNTIFKALFGNNFSFFLTYLMN